MDMTRAVSELAHLIISGQGADDIRARAVELAEGDVTVAAALIWQADQRSVAVFDCAA